MSENMSTVLSEQWLGIACAWPCGPLLDGPRRLAHQHSDAVDADHEYLVHCVWRKRTLEHLLTVTGHWNGSHCTVGSKYLSRDTDGWLNTKGLKAATPSCQRANTRQTPSVQRLCPVFPCWTRCWYAWLLSLATRPRPAICKLAACLTRIHTHTKSVPW